MNKLSKTIEHYDSLIDENNDPVHDSPLLREYTDKWDGQKFIDSLQLSPDKDVLEIGVGTGRLAIKVCGDCNAFFGIDVSQKTIERAAENLRDFDNCTLICADFLKYQFENSFDVIYSSLTFIHISDNKAAIKKASKLLKANGRFVLSFGKNQDKYLTMNNRSLEIFPSIPNEIKAFFTESGLVIEDFYETEFAFVIVGVQPNKKFGHITRPLIGGIKN